MSHAENAYAVFQEKVGAVEGVGEWFTIDQDRINAFAEVTEDRQFIHVDPELSAQLSPWGVPIAHGFLTLSLLTILTSTIAPDFRTIEGIVMGVNYGFEKIRFVNPVKVNSKIRASSTISNVELKDANNLQITKTITVEIEGETKPALIAEWITRAVYA